MSSVSKPPRKQKAITTPRDLSRPIVYSVIFAVVIYLAFSLWISADDLTAASRSFSWVIFPLLLVLSLSNYMLRFGKWQYYLNRLSIKIPRHESLIIYFSGLSLSITPGKLGEVIRSLFLKRRFGYPVSVTAPIVFADRLTDVMALVLLSVVGAYGFSYGQRLIWIVSILVIALILIIIIRPLGERGITLLMRVSFFRSRSEKIRKAYESSHTLLTPRAIGVPLTLSVLGWGLEALGFYFVFRGFGLSQGILSAMFIYAFSTLVGAVSFLPGGLGTTEGAITGLLRVLNIPLNISVLSALIIRIATLWFGVVIGLIFLVIAQRRIDISTRLKKVR